jgi:polysaccharide biosynthesis transport protein
MSPGRLAQAIWARKLAFCLVFSVIAGSSIAFCYLAAPIFQSEALIMVSEGQSQQSRYPETLRYQINSQLYTVESEDVLRQAIASVGARRLLSEPARQRDSAGALAAVDFAILNLIKRAGVSIGTLLPFPREAAEQLPQPAGTESDFALLVARRQLAVTALKDSQVLQLTFRNSDPVLAQEFLSSVVAAFLQRQADLSGNAEAPSFYRQQATRYRSDYEGASAKLREFAKLHSTYAIRQEVELALSRRDEILGKLATTRGSIADKEAQVATLQDTLSQLRKRISVPSEILGPKFQVPAGRDLLTDNKIPQNDPPLLLVRVFQETAQSLVNLNASVVGLHALEESQRKALANVETKLADLSSAESEFERLKSEVDQASAILESHVKRAAEAQMTADWNASEKLSNVKVLQPATKPVKPVFPQKPILIALGAIIALVGAAAACVGLDTLARRRSARPVTPAPTTLEVPDGRPDVHRFFSERSRPATGREEPATFEPARQPSTVPELSDGVPNSISPKAGERLPGLSMAHPLRPVVEDGVPPRQHLRAPFLRPRSVGSR